MSNCNYFKEYANHCSIIDKNHVPSNTDATFCDADCTFQCVNNVCNKPIPIPTPSSPDKPSSDCIGWQNYNKYGNCISESPSDQSQNLPSIENPTIRPSLNDLKKISTNIHKGNETIKGSPWIPACPTKKLPRDTSRKWRMTLWHEGFSDVDINNLTQYLKDFTDFIKYKNFDRSFLQSGDPSLTDNTGDVKFPYADPKFVVDNYLSNVPQDDNFEAGLLACIDPRYIWYYDYQIAGGIWGNNPNYINKPSEPYYCQQPYRGCNVDNDPLCSMNSLQNTDNFLINNDLKIIDSCNIPCTGTKPVCLNGKCVEPTCTTIKDYCNDGKCCLQYPPGCPNNIEQFFKYVGHINILAGQKGVKKITTIALDGEDISIYGADQWGLVQLWQAARKYAPDIVEIGYAHGPNTDCITNWTNASYPELYWIGELKPTIGCSGCPAGSDKSAPGCIQCLNSIYQTNINNPKGMLNAFSKFIDETPFKLKTNRQGVCPLFSIESAHLKGENGSKSNQTSCIADKYNKNKFCGTFDGFGDWDWDTFYMFLNLFAAKYNVNEIGVYEFQFVPLTWLQTETSIEKYTPSKINCKSLKDAGSCTKNKCYWDLPNSNCLDKQPVDCKSLKDAGSCTKNKCYWDLPNSHCLDKQPVDCKSLKDAGSCTTNKCYWDIPNSHCLDKQPVDCKSLKDACLLYTSPSPRDRQKSRMPSSA